MFKKKPTVKGFTNIKSSLRRDFLEDICRLYGIPKEQLSPEIAKDILPNPTQESQAITAREVGCLLYMDSQSVPTWITVQDDGRDVYVPTVYTLWRCPYLVPIVHTHDFVIREALMTGAHLMLPGTVPPFDHRIKAGSVVAIASTKEPRVPVAVGIARMDLSGIEKVLGEQGRAVEVVHIIEDELFKMAKRPVAKPADFAEERLVQPWTLAVNQPEGPEQTEEIAETGTEAQTEPVEELAEGVSRLTVEDVDNFFYRALLQSIATEQIETPISSSSLMSNYVLKNLPPVDAAFVNIKKTSWKKAAKFLKAMEKDNVLKVKGKGDDLTVTSLIGRDDDRIKNFVPHRVKKTAGTVAKAPTPKKGEDKLQLVTYYKSKGKVQVKDFLGETKPLLLKEDIKKGVSEYVKARDLVNKSNPRQILLDDVLTRAVGAKSAMAMDRSDVFPQILEHSFTEYSALVAPGDDVRTVVPFRGTLPPIKIVTEMVIGRKVVTRIHGYENYHIHTEEFNSELKTKCSASTTVGPNRHNPKITEISVQGPQAKKVIELLTSKGVKPQWIDEENKLKKRK